MDTKKTTDVYRLMTLLNELHRTGEDELLLFMPYRKEPVFSINLVREDNHNAKSAVRLLLRFREYRSFIHEFKSSSAEREIPDFGTIQALLLQAGIIQYPNFPEFLATLEKLTHRDFHQGQRPVFMGLDTNLLRDLFYSANYHILQHIPDNKIGFCISPNVKDELSFDRRKYKNRDLETLSAFSSDKKFNQCIRTFFNQPCLNDRLCRLGFSELEKVKQIHWIELLPELDPRENEDSPDLNIIKTYKLAAADRNADILLLSRDDGFIGHAEGIPGLMTLQIDKPLFNQKVYPVSKWRQLCQLIYLSSVIFGVIRLRSKSEDFYLQGIWSGKKSENWTNECLQISSNINNSRVFGCCQQAWSVLDAMSWQPIFT